MTPGAPSRPTFFHRPRPPQDPGSPRGPEASRASDDYVKRKDKKYVVEGIELSDEQIRAAERVMGSDKRVRIITGRAGAGKSLLTKYLQQEYDIRVTATTGRAAVNVNGTTVHNMFALRTTDWKCFSSGYLDFNMKRCPRDIIIDEASMCGLKMAQYLSDTIDRYDKRLILVGDWAQASPVKDSWMFDTSFWRDAEYIKLNECHRQTDRAFIDALDEARNGGISRDSEGVFRSCVDPIGTDTPGVVRMYATNAMTKDWNDFKLDEHLSTTGFKPFQLNSTFRDEREDDKQRSAPRNGAFRDSAIEDSRLAHQDLFAKGAQVLITKNAKGTVDVATGDIHKEYVNGDTGIIEDVLNGAGEPLDPEKTWMPDDIAYIRIRRTRDDYVICLGRTAQEFKDPQDKVTHKVIGFSLALGYALSIHRSQGMTVDNAWLDMSSIMCFPDGNRHGLGYVGLSRTRTLRGLKISAFLPGAVVCDDVVKPWI